MHAQNNCKTGRWGGVTGDKGTEAFELGTETRCCWGLAKRLREGGYWLAVMMVGKHRIMRVFCGLCCGVDGLSRDQWAVVSGAVQQQKKVF